MFQGANAYHNQYVMNNCSGVIHVVKERDTLYKIGQMYGVSVSALMYANPYVNVYNLQIGDELCVPVYSMNRNMEKDQTNMQPAETPETGNQMPGQGMQNQNMSNQGTMQPGTTEQRRMQPGTSEQRRMQPGTSEQRTMQPGTTEQRTMQQRTPDNSMGVQTENGQWENDMSDVMKIQESRLEYEISDDSEL